MEKHNRIIYTTEEQELIENAAKEYADDIVKKGQRYSTNMERKFCEKGFKEACQSPAMQQIIESRIKQAKIELLKEIWHNGTFGFIEQKLTELIHHCPKCGNIDRIDEY